MKLKLIAWMVKQIKGPDYLYFDTPVEVDLVPPYHAWGISIAPDNRVYLMNYDREWHELREEQANASKVIDAVYEKLQRITSKKAA